MRLSIGEASAELGIPAPTLRYYDKEGLLPYVGRTPNGTRFFTEDDLEWLHMIECLKRSGLSIKEIRQFVEWYVQGDSTLEQRRELFHRRKRAIEEELEHLRETLEFVEYKCWFYDTAVEAGTIDAPRTLKPCETPEFVQRYREERAEIAAERAAGRALPSAEVPGEKLDRMP